MKNDALKGTSIFHKMIDYVIWFLWPRIPENAKSVSEFLYIHRWNKRFQYVKRVLLPGLIIAVVVGLGFSYWGPGGKFTSIFLFVVSFVGIMCLIFSMRFLEPSFNLYDKYQEIKCPKCNEYIPLYIWQCPNCDTTYKDTHIFHNCGNCDAKVGKLHKNLQSIKCMNENCKYELYFCKPYEGGFNESSFRGE